MEQATKPNLIFYIGYAINRILDAKNRVATKGTTVELLLMVY